MCRSSLAHGDVKLSLANVENTVSVCTGTLRQLFVWRRLRLTCAQVVHGHQGGTFDLDD